MYGFTANGEGYGVRTYADGIRYAGQWSRNLYNGQGLQTLPDGSTMEGQWVDGFLYGKGVAQFADGASYVGEFNHSRFHGHGTKVYNNGDVYEGEWKNGVPDGRGKKKFSTGFDVEALFKDGKEVQGTATVKRGLIVVLTIPFWNGTYHGETIMHRGKRIPHGHGRATDTHREYVGEWRFGQRDGFGRNTNARGSVYEGEWVGGDPHGQGQGMVPRWRSLQGQRLGVAYLMGAELPSGATGMSMTESGPQVSFNNPPATILVWKTKAS